MLFKVIAATVCVTLAASLAARLGATTMAAFQICLQVWLTSSLISDGLAVAGQVDANVIFVLCSKIGILKGCTSLLIRVMNNVFFFVEYCRR